MNPDNKNLSKDDLKKFAESLNNSFAQTEEKLTKQDLGGFANQLGQSFAETIEPMMVDMKEEMSKNHQMMADMHEEMLGAMSNVSVEMPEMPEIKIPEIKVPEPKVTVNMPPVKFPEMKFPEQRPLLEGVSMKNPIPVIMTNPDGTPFVMSMLSGGGSGGFRNVVIGDIAASAYSRMQNADGRLRVSVETGGSGLTDSELRAAHLDVQQVSGAMDSVNVVDAFGSTAVGSVFNADNRIRVSVETGGSGLTDTELRAAHLDVQQVSGATDSINLLQVGGNAVVVGTGYQDNAIRVVHATDAVVSTVVNSGTITAVTDITNSLKAALIDSSGVQYSGSNPLPVSATQSGTWNIGTVTTVTAVTDITNSLKAALIDSSGVQYSGSNPFSVSAAQSGTWNVGTVTTVTAVTDVTNSLKSAIIDSSGVQYSGSNPVPVTLISGGLTSTIVVGPTVADAADDGSAPLKTGGIARQANPTAVAANDMVTSTHDDVGRQVFRPLQVSDLIQTAYVSVANGTETALLAGSASTFHDLIYVMMANSSDAAVTVDVRSGTANR